MKPNTQPYNRNSRQGLKLLTVNPCNRFIVQSLIRWKINVQKKGLNQFYTYNLAIASVRKYPLPVLCFEQMKTMEGFGKFFCNSVINIVKKHYKRGRLPTPQQRDEDDKEHQEYLRRQMKKMRNTNRRNNPDGEDDQDFDEKQDNQSQYSEFNDNFQSQFGEGEQSYVDDENSDSNSECSEASSRSAKSYKPKPGCQVYNIFKAISAVLKQKQKQPSASKTISRAEINTQLYHWKMDKVRSWIKLSDKLKQSGYIKVDPKDQDFITITTKGRDYLTQIQQSQLQKSNQNSANNIIIFRKQKLKSIESSQQLQKLVLLTNTRGSFKSEEQFITMLSEQSKKIKIQSADFQLASFVWMLDGKILDFMVLRFKMDNFDEEEFKSICLRARNSECKNIYALFQLPADKNKKMTLSPEEFSSIVVKARASGLKVIKSCGQADSVKFLQAATSEIEQRVKRVAQGQQMLMLGTLQIYNQKNKKLLPITVKQVNKKMLKCIPRMHRDVIECISQKLPTLAVSHNYMLRLNDRMERVNFLNWMLKGLNYKPGTIQLYDDLLFDQTYDLNEEEEEESKQA